MNVKSLASILSVCALSLGCTKTAPSFGVLDQNTIPMPMFSGSTTLELVNLTATQTNAISGQCDHKIHDLQVSAVGSLSSFSTASAFTTGGITVACGTTGTFSFTLKSLTDLGFTITDNTKYEIQLRAITDGGISNPSTIRIEYSTSGGTGPKRVLNTSGSTISPQNSTQPRRAVSGSFQAEIRVDHALNSYANPSVRDAMSVKTSTHFRMKSGPAAEND